MQKLVTVRLAAQSTKGPPEVFVEEHLRELLAEGWRVVSVTPSGAASVGYDVFTWFAVLLEKDGS